MAYSTPILPIAWVRSDASGAIRKATKGDEGAHYWLKRAMMSFINWCVVERGISDANAITSVEGKRGEATGPKPC